MKRTALAAAAIVFALVAQADAATRTFYAPNLHGDRLSACIGAGTVCGKPVADKLCNARGFQQALTYRLDRNEHHDFRLRTIENEIAATNTAEPAFVFVKCYTQKAQSTLVSQ